MKLTINVLRNLCLFFLVLRDQAEAEGLVKRASNAEKQYRFYDRLLLQAQQMKEKRPSGVGAGQPQLWKILIKSSLPLTGGVGNNGTEVIGCPGSRTGQPAEAAKPAIRGPVGPDQMVPQGIARH